MNDNETISEEVLDAMGVSRPVYEELQTVVGHMPTVDELSTLLAMWNMQGRRQGLLTWLKGLPHAVERHDYLEHEQEPQSRDVREPRVKECIQIARNLCAELQGRENFAVADNCFFRHRGDAIYMVGDVSLFFGNSVYSRQVLHLVDNPLTLDGEDETASYLDLILSSLFDDQRIFSMCRVSSGGLFGTLVRCSSRMGVGFDILSCREVRMDSFLFGEKGVRYVVSMDEPREDFFLQKLVEARVNCCFLGRTTKGRILVDDMDFGPVNRYLVR